MRLWDSIYNFLDNNKEWLFSGVGVSIIAYIISKIFNVKKRKLKFTFSFIVSFEQFGNQFGPKIPMLFLNIINVGNTEVFINEPVVISSENIDGDNMFQIFGTNSNYSSPIKLSFGEKIELKYNSLSLHKNFFSKMKDGSFIRFMTTDTLDKEYYSPKLYAKKIYEHNKLSEIR